MDAKSLKTNNVVPSVEHEENLQLMTEFTTVLISKHSQGYVSNLAFKEANITGEATMSVSHVQ